MHRTPVGCHTRILRRSHRTEAERHTTLVATHREPRSYRLPRSATQSRDKTGRNFGLEEVGLVHADFLVGLECVQDARCRDDQPSPAPRFFFQIKDLAWAVRGM